MRRAARLAVLYVLEAVAALLALTIFVGAAALWRLAEGPVDAEVLRAAATQALLEAVDADAATIGALQVSFDPARAALVVTASDVSAVRGGEVLVSAERIETALALDLLLVMRAAPVRISAEGGAFSIVRDLNGRISAGLGAPDAVRTRPDNNQGGFGALTAGLNSQESGPLSRLSEIDLRGVDLTVIDEASGLSLLFQDARASLALDAGGLTLDLSGGLVTSAGLAPVALNLETERSLERVFIDLRVRDLVLAAAAPVRGPGALLRAVDAPLALDLVMDASASDGLRTASVDLQAGAGSVRVGGQDFAVGSASATLVLDAEAGQLDIGEVRVTSDLVTLDLSGRLFDLSVFTGALPTQARYALELSEGAFDWPGLFPEPQAWRTVAMEGRLDAAALEIVFDRLDVDLQDDASGRLTGGVTLERSETGWLPAIRLSGPIEGRLSKADVLRHWPVDFALGARDWVRESIISGEASRARLDLNIPAEALAARVLENEHLSLSFSFSDADVRYVSTMTPLIGLSGEAVLRGNSLSLTGGGGAIGGLAMDTIFVEIARLNPKGSIARFGGAGTGSVREVLGLLSEPPLDLGASYGIDPDVFEGEGAMSFEIRRPMLRHVPAEDLGYSVSGRFENVSAPSGFEGVRLANGTVEISGDATGLRAAGEADLAGARAAITWTETFGLGPEAQSSRIEIATRMTARALDQLGLPLRRFLDGAIGVQGVVTGRGFDFAGVDLALDLQDAAVALPAGLWDKAPGDPAAVQLGVQFAADGALAFETFSIQSQALQVDASAALGPDGRLLSAAAPRLEIPGRLDLSLSADRPEGPQGVLRLQVSGDYLDAGDLIRLDAPGAGVAVTAPVALEASIARVLLREVAFTGVGLSARLGQDGLEQASLTARTASGDADVSFALTPAETGRLLVMETGDAGAVLAALAGYDNASGGRLNLQASVPAPGQDGPVTGALGVEGFTLERMPLLARVLAAGSLEGLAGLLSGQGIEFERLETDFVWQNGGLEMREARVVGPALGVTWTGLVDFQAPRVDVDGTILPSYGVNSVLGSVPVLGDLFTGRQGEGVIGVTFSVSGPFEETRVTANPLSALAPGVFRRIFEGTTAERELRALEERRRDQREQGEAAGETPQDTPDDLPGPDAEPGDGGEDVPGDGAP